MSITKQPEWLNNAVFYEIYPQSFNDTNADGIGDFNGIIEKLDYIRELGCNAIWINPCFKSPFGDAGYDVEDYYTAAPRYGTNEDLARVFSEAHARGISFQAWINPLRCYQEDDAPNVSTTYKTGQWYDTKDGD